MSLTWRGPPPPSLPAPPWTAWPLVILRVVAFVLYTLALLPLLFLAQWLGRDRDRVVVRWWSRAVVTTLGLGLRVEGKPVTGGILAANHVCWADPMVIGAAAPVFFVAKREVVSWPVLGLLVRISRNEFIDRRRADARRQTESLRARLADGQLMCFFPEGTSTDGQRVLPFRSTLFAPVFAGEADTLVQPVALHYQPRRGSGLPRSFYGWWGDQPFASSLLRILGRSWGGTVTVTFLPALQSGEFADRKQLAAACGQAVAERIRTQLLDNATA